MNSLNVNCVYSLLVLGARRSQLQRNHIGGSSSAGGRSDELDKSAPSLLEFKIDQINKDLNSNLFSLDTHCVT